MEFQESVKFRKPNSIIISLHKYIGHLSTTGRTATHNLLAEKGQNSDHIASKFEMLYDPR